MINKISKVNHRALFSLCILLAAFSLLSGCGRSHETSISHPLIHAEPWIEAGSLFKTCPEWLGGDGAYSIDLGKGRVLWLFGDSIIALSENHSRKKSVIIRNSVAIQTGYDPLSAEINFYWDRSGQKSASFFPEKNGKWFWPGHGIRTKNLLIFLTLIQPSDKGLGFEPFEWTAASISNPDTSPDRWKIKWLETPQNDYGIIVGSSSVIKYGGYIYAFGTEASGDHNIYVVRWPSNKFMQDDLSDFQWWNGKQQGWVMQHFLKEKPKPIIYDGHTEFSINYIHTLDRFMLIQAIGFGAANISMRISDTLTGPWSGPIKLFRPPEARVKNILIYGAKSHPELEGADIVLTYNVNHMDFDYLLEHNDIYYPKFLKVSINQ